MINSIDPVEFLDMLPVEISEECRGFGISLAQQRAVCECVNNLRNGVPEKVEVAKHRLANVDLRSARFTNLENKRTFSIKFQKHNLQKLTFNWKVEFAPHINYIVHFNDVVTWYINKKEDEIMPLAYKEFLKCRFQGVNMTAVYNLVTFHERYINAFNDIYQRELNKYQECA